MVDIKEGSLPDSRLMHRRTEGDVRWWHLPPGRDRARAIRDAVEHIERDQSSRRTMDELYMQLYGAGNAHGLGMTTSMRWHSTQPIALRLNLVQQACDAMQAKVAKLRPRVRFLTTRGDWGLRKRAEAMEQQVHGEFMRNGVDDSGPRVANDAFVVGDGFWRVDRRQMGHPVIERCLPGEIMVDAWDGLRGRPRSIYHVQLLDRDYLAMVLGKGRNTKTAQIVRDASTEMPPAAYRFLGRRPGHSDLLYVISAWHLPSFRGAKDGAFAMVLADGELLDPAATRFDRHHFPIVQMSWQPRMTGFYSKGIVEEIMPQQLEINYTLEKIQHILHNVSTVRHWIQAGGRIELRAQKMTNVPGEILKYYGANPPITDVVNAVPQEMFQHVADLKDDALASIGLSPFFATAIKPAGLNSGEAQRVHEDVGTERQIIKGRNYEGAHLRLADVVVDVKREIALDSSEEEVPIVVKTKRARGVTVRSLSFKDADMHRDSYVTERLPQGALPGLPSGRVATLSEWLQNGAITVEEWRELSEMPDLKSHETPSSTTRDNVLSAIEAIADDGEYHSPHSMLDLPLAKMLVASAFNRLQWEGLSEDRLDLLARYASELVDIEMLAQPQQPALQQAAGAQQAVVPAGAEEALAIGAGGGPPLLPQ